MSGWAELAEVTYNPNLGDLKQQSFTYFSPCMFIMEPRWIEQPLFATLLAAIVERKKKTPEGNPLTINCFCLESTSDFCSKLAARVSVAIPPNLRRDEKCNPTTSLESRRVWKHLANSTYEYQSSLILSIKLIYSLYFSSNHFNQLFWCLEKWVINSRMWQWQL